MSLVTLLLALLVACDGGLEPEGDAEPPGDGSVDASADAAADSSDDAASDARPDAEATADAEAGEDAGEWVRPDRPEVSSPPAGASWRYGGGVGYPDMVEPAWPIVTVVRSRAELEAALALAEAGEVVYVADDATIDLTGTTVCIPGGVWLASGRGRGGSAGGLITTTETVRDPVLEVCGDDVRVTGLRIIGDEPTECPPEYPDACTGVDRTGGVNCRDCTPASVGLRSRGFDRLEVDNCELAGWSSAAISLSDSVGVHVHHSHIHHTQRQGLGYGLVLMRGGEGEVTALVEWCRFESNRHAIAGSGEPGQDYEARNNLVHPHAIGHVFDMHGENENTDNGSEWAGGEILVHGNTVLVPNYYAMVIRGRPQHGAWLYDNCLARSSAETAAQQRYFFGNFWLDRSPAGSAPNRYGRSAADCETVRFCASSGGSAPYRSLAASSLGLASVGLADLDGDGRADVFRADGAAWHWSRSGSSAWERLNTSTLGLDRLAFGDFDGDGRADVFDATGTEWRVSDGGTSRWRTLRAATERLSALAFGDFDGDGRTDVFTATGSEWRWSRSGTAAWARLNASSIGLAALAFADFDGDGRTDVFNATGSVWRVSPGGSAPWTTVNSSSATLAGLAFADLDGDRRADVLRASRETWLVSFGATSRWQRLAVTRLSLAEVAFADLDGDGAADAFRTGCL